MKKILMVLAVALALTLVLSACGDGGGSGGGGRSLMIGAENMDESARDRFEEFFIEPLRKAFPDDDIQYEMFTERQTLQVQVAAGAGPDFFHLDGPTDGVEFFKSERIIALDDYAAKYGWKDLFYPWAYNSGFFEGQLISLPNSFEGMHIYYNVDVFEAQGWDYPTNRAELEAIADAAMEAGIMAFSFGNSDYQGAVDWLYSIFMNSYPGPAALKDALEGRTRVDEGLVLESMELLQEWWERGYFSDGMALGMSMDDMLAVFADGRAAMMLDGTWAVGDLSTTFQTNWISDLVPELRPGVGRIMPLATGGVYVVNVASKDPDFAAEVLNEIFTDIDTHHRSVDEAFFQPFPVKAFNVSKMTSWEPNVIDMYTDIITAMNANDVGFCAWTFFPSDMRVYMNENTDNMFMGVLTPQEFMTQAQTFIDKALADGTAPVVP